MPLELTTRFRGISTSPAATRQGPSGPADALKRCYGALNYVTRADAIGVVTWAGLKDEDGAPAATLQAARLALRQRFRDEAAKGGKVGRRLATTGIVSLPNSWDRATVKAATERLAQALAPEGSGAAVLIVEHIDKSNNAHLHFVAVDGVESREAAEKRAGEDAQRIRRRNVQRFNERGAPKRWRRRIADILNATAMEHGEATVEWRSFKERGLLRTATRHEGPEARARKAREAKDELGDLFTDSATDIFDLMAEQAVGLIRHDDANAEQKGGEQRQRE